MVMSPYRSLFTSFSRGYVEVCVCTALPEVDEVVTLLAEILYLNLSKNIFGEFILNICHIQRAHATSANVIVRSFCPFDSRGFLVF